MKKPRKIGKNCHPTQTSILLLYGKAVQFRVRRMETMHVQDRKEDEK